MAETRKTKQVVLPGDVAFNLFYNGHRIARYGDPPTKWITMQRTHNGQAVHREPMTAEIEATIKGGQYYLVDGVEEWLDDPLASTDFKDYLLLAGGTMTGPILTSTANPTDDMEAVNRGYVEASMAAYVQAAGDEMTGPLVMRADAANPAASVSMDSTGPDSNLFFLENGLLRWGVRKDGSAETGNNKGSDFLIDSYDDAGNFIQTEFKIPRNSVEFVETTGTHQFNGGIRVPNSRTAIFTASGTGAGFNRIIQAADSALNVTMELRSVQDGAGHGTFELYSGTAKALSSTSDSPPNVKVEGDAYARGVKLATEDFAVAKTGDAMTGPLVLDGPPASALAAATKDYVDVAVATAALYQGTWQVAANTPDLNASTPQNGYSYIAQTAVAGTPEMAPAGIPGIGGMSIDSGDVIQWSEAASVWQKVAGSSLSIAQGDARYINVTGDTMTGTLTLYADPVANLQAATKAYVDTKDGVLSNSMVFRSGDTMTGALTLPADPMAPLQAATQQYVDKGDAANTATINAKLNKAGDTMTGPLVLSGDPTAVLGAATKQYVDAKAAAGAGAFLPLAGGTLTGPLVLSGPPSAALNPATKAYADAASALAVKKAGDSMSGDLNMGARYITNLHDPGASGSDAATKNYVDSKVKPPRQTYSGQIKGPFGASNTGAGIVINNMAAGNYIMIVNVSWQPTTADWWTTGVQISGTQLGSSWQCNTGAGRCTMPTQVQQVNLPATGNYTFYLAPCNSACKTDAYDFFSLVFIPV
jgi:hypothetical protein